MLTSTAKHLSVLYQSEGRAVCTSLPVWHVTHSRLLAELLCPPWRRWPPCRPHARLSGYKERQHPNLLQVIIPFNLTKQNMKMKETSTSSTSPFHYIRRDSGRNVCRRPISLENQHWQMLHSQQTRFQLLNPGTPAMKKILHNLNICTMHHQYVNILSKLCTII